MIAKLHGEAVWDISITDCISITYRMALQIFPSARKKSYYLGFFACNNAQQKHPVVL